MVIPATAFVLLAHSEQIDMPRRKSLILLPFIVYTDVQN
jgi:hypothetical protein